ncbi:hypothetical protein GCM10018980_28540 [Streptomyces capoamus]|uniref:Clp R domain-containing protein n=1 Tax=Streptomyces capoamus TaxID=68183 RepID=A0A919EX16_9ACTN|nr:hypothetical protein GCM10010501_53270 [Streptomyces libani subsp. rufus]GHG48342.1 hypothetical protein GCM10018980_28540 [Streptomyces capoamus]
MFERFTKDARAVVEGAYAHAEEGGSASVDAGHLLLALLDREESRAASALAALGLARPPEREAVRRALREARRRAGLTRAEADALAGQGGKGARSGPRGVRPRVGSLALPAPAAPCGLSRTAGVRRPAD